MIAFGSQRAGGGDLATHLSNAEDNEYVEVADLRGAIAEDLHGAFSEWEAQARAMTKAKKYLYSLSVNPDPAQGRLTRDQYMDYIARAEERLGLGGQPRAVVFHIKEQRDGNLREHCHVVWSRTDVQDLKAIPIAFDRQKLMMVAREFARDHGLSLPGGYETGRAKADQLSLYDKAQLDQTGLSKEERMELITDLWRHSDSAEAFVGALEDHGYILATGKRPYVLVDIYGHTNALPRMIDDKSVRAKDIVAFLEKDFPTKPPVPGENGPDPIISVEDAKELAARHRAEREQHRKVEQNAGQLEILEASQQKRREKLARQHAEVRQRQEEEKHALALENTARVQVMIAAHAKQDFEVQFRRAQSAPSGLAGFLARVSGVAYVRKQLHLRDDRKRHEQQRDDRRRLEQQNEDRRRKMDHIQELVKIEQRRKEHALEQTFARERRSLQTTQQRQHAMQMRRGHDHMPALGLTLGPPGRKAAPHKAMNRHTATTAKEMNVKARPRGEQESVHMREDFSFAANPKSRKRSDSSRGSDVEVRRKDHRGGGKQR